MAPPGNALGAMHLVRRIHPMGIHMRRKAANLDHAVAAEIHADQERRLRGLVRWAAARSPFYRRWFAEAGVDARSIRGLADLPILPVLERQHLVDQPDDFCAYPRHMMWKANSSGTSGSVVTTYRTVGSSVFELAALERQWGWFGLPRSPRRAILRGSDFHADNPGQVARELRGGRQLLVSSFHLTPGSLPAICAALRAFQPDVVEGWPSSITLLAGLLHQSGERLPVKAIITSSEVVGDSQRALMREVFGGPIIDHYGQTERVAMAGTCEAGNYHIFPDYGIVELVPAAEHASEIVATPLHNWGFPLFRYRTGDTVGPTPAGPCACGRSFPLLGTIDGRVEDAFTAADGRPIPLPHALVKNLTGLREVQAVQRAPGRFEIRIVPGVGFDSTAVAALAHRNVERLVGPGQLVVIQQMTRIPRTERGKLKTTVVLNDLVDQA